MSKMFFLKEATEIVCGGASILRIIKFVFLLLKTVTILIPMGLIVMLTIDIAKNVIAGDAEAMKKNVNLAIKRLIVCVAIFLIDPIVTTVNSLLEEQGVDYAKCIKIAKTEDLSKYEILKETEDYSDVKSKDLGGNSSLTIVDSSESNSNSSGGSGSSGSSSNSNSSGNGKTLQLTKKEYEHLEKYNQSGQSQSPLRASCTTPGGNIAGTACGLSTYMATRYALTKQDTDYMKFAEEACGTKLYNGLGASYEYAYSELFLTKKFYEDAYGIRQTKIDSSYETFVKELKKGNVVNVMIQCGHPTISEGGFNKTPNGHFIALISYDSEKEKIYVYNPNLDNTGWTSKKTVKKYIVSCTKLATSASKVYTTKSSKK